jgi:hypothetical protein
VSKAAYCQTEYTTNDIKYKFKISEHYIRKHLVPCRTEDWRYGERFFYAKDDVKKLVRQVRRIEKKKASRPIRSRILKPDVWRGEDWMGWLGGAIHSVNKAAKRARDAARRNYERGQYALATAYRERKEDLYELKSKAIEKSIHFGFAEFVCFHSLKAKRMERVKMYDDENCESNDYYDDDDDSWEPSYYWDEQEVEETIYLACWRIGKSVFHELVDSEPQGEIIPLPDGWESQAKKSTGLSTKNAVGRLNAFLNQNPMV